MIRSVARSTRESVSESSAWFADRGGSATADRRNAVNARWQNLRLCRTTVHGMAWKCLLLLLLALSGASLAADASNDSNAACRVLLVTGEDYPGHKWGETTPVLKSLLEEEPRIDVDVLDDLTQLHSTRLSEYQVVVMHFKNYDPQVPGRLSFDSLTDYVKSGGGLVLVHFACGAFQEFRKDFEVLAGRAWNPELRGHDPYGEFRVQITDSDHEITRGLSSFETTDELYTCLDGVTPITVLAQSKSKVDGKQYPMAFVLDYGKGRVFHSVLGHDVQAFSAHGVGSLYRRGTLWAAGMGPK